MTVRVALVSLLVSMLVLGGVVSFLGGTVQERIGLDAFRTQADFQAYLSALRQAESSTGGLQWPQVGPFTDVTSATGTREADGGFSTTNVQVAGVDEADIVKTDGEFLYLASGEEVVLIRAHPPASMGIVSKIRPSDFVGDGDSAVRILGLFLYEDTLVVISSSLATFGGHRILPASDYGMLILESRTVVSLFSVADPRDPTFLQFFELSGSYQASRLKGGVVYLVLHQTLWIQGDEVSYPTFCADGRCEPYDAHRIFYDAEASDAGSLTNVVAIDLEGEQVGYLSVLTGFASTVYMSLENLYVTFAKWGRLGLPFPRPDLTSTGTGFTSIYRISVAGTNLVPVAGANVRGWVLNQFSLDEHRSYLRVATTTWGSATENNVYVLDPDLAVVGALEGLARGETIYSARFVGELGYLVTFQKVDPFFVLDLSIPDRPEVL
ncbi:MAG: beta-propeller domain-containing protein, partial [Thermoplasmata archaeon]